MEALHQLLNKNQQSLGFYNRLFFVPKPNNQWRPILDPSMPGPEPHVPNRVTYCYREASTLGPVTHETHRVASQKQLEGARDPKN